MSMVGTESPVSLLYVDVLFTWCAVDLSDRFLRQFHQIFNRVEQYPLEFHSQHPHNPDPLLDALGSRFKAHGRLMKNLLELNTIIRIHFYLVFSCLYCVAISHHVRGILTISFLG